MTSDEQEARIAAAIVKLAELAVYTPEELVESAERMRRIADDIDGTYRRIIDKRVEEGSGP